MSVQDGWYMFDSDFNRLHEAQKQNGVVTGLAVSELPTPAMSVRVATGEANVNGKRIKKTSTTDVTISTSDPTNPRKDIITLDDAGTLAAVAGTAQAAAPSGQTGANTYEPKPPDIPANKIILAEVWVGAGVTVIYNADITDRRVFVKHQIRMGDLSIKMDKIFLKTSRYYQYMFRVDPVGNQTDVASGYLWAQVFLVPRKIKINRIGIQVAGAGAAGARIRVGIYTDDGSGYPSSLISGTDVAELNAETTGFKENTIDVSLDPGIYWIAFLHNDSTVDLRRGYSSVDPYLLGLLAADSDNLLVSHRVAQTYGALPSTYPSGATENRENWFLRVQVSEVVE